MCLWNTIGPAFLWPWYLTLTLTDNLELGTNKKVLSHVKYEGTNSYRSKDMANVKVFADKQTDKRMDRPKTIFPQSIDVGA